MIRKRRARIVATLGPASRAPDQVITLAKAGADVFRLNFSHGTHDDHAAAYAAVRAASKVVDRHLGVLADLQGPKLRLGQFVNGGIDVKAGHVMRLDLDTALGDDKRVGMPHPEIFAAMKPGSILLVDDGKARLEVRECDKTSAVVEVLAGSKLMDRKGVTLKGAVLALPALTEKDHKDLAFALRLGVDWVALSFVQRPEDVAQLKKLVEGRAACLAKIEKPSAIDCLDEILDYCDGLMVARGDLGVEMEPEEVPVAQKTILRAGRRRGAPVIVATQMMELMISSPTPTRAEASDVANAIYEGADAVMLSAESASGQYPVEAVTMMNRIAERVEQDPLWPELMQAEHGPLADHDADILIAAASKAAENRSTSCLVAFTLTGGAARRLARERPLQPVLALTPNPQVATRLALVWGLEARVAGQPDSLDSMTTEAVEMACELGMAPPGGRILIVAGTPFGITGTTNLLRMAHAPTRFRRKAGTASQGERETPAASGVEGGMTSSSDFLAADFLAADWGTSNLRAWRLGADGTVRAVQRLPWGVAGLQPGEAARRLKDELRPMLGAESLPAVLCGMVGSRMGIAEARYADCPAGAADVAQRLLRVDEQTFIVPGLRCERPDGYPDVIRGEETKVLGWLRLDPRRMAGEHVLCLPGTHGKWVLVKDGRIHHFMTCMTGELFALLSDKSVLKPGAPPSDQASFDEGLNFGAAEGPLASRLFTVRARMVGAGLEGGKAASFLSGLLIGDEVARLPQLLGLKAGSTIGLMGEKALCDLYGPALSARGLKVELADAEQAVIAGLVALKSAMNGART